MLDSIRQDVVYALRGFRRSRGFTLVALLVLAFGIATNTTIFSVVNAVLLRPLPVAQPEELRFLSVVFSRSFEARLGVPYKTFEQLATERDVFTGVAGFFSDSAKLGDEHQRHPRRRGARHDGLFRRARGACRFRADVRARG